MQKVCYKGHMGLSKKANSKNKKPIPLSDEIKNALLGKELLGFAKHGNELPDVTEVRWRERTSIHVRAALQFWLDTGEFEHLLSLLEGVPAVISHPAMVLLVRRLQWLARWTDKIVGATS